VSGDLEMWTGLGEALLLRYQGELMTVIREDRRSVSASGVTFVYHDGTYERIAIVRPASAIESVAVCD
jgi:hypothetical protein